MCVPILQSPTSSLGMLLAASLLPRAERSRIDSLTSNSCRTSVRANVIDHDHQADAAIILLVLPMTTTIPDVVPTAQQLVSTAVGLHLATTTTHAIATLLLLAVYLVVAH